MTESEQKFPKLTIWDNIRISFIIVFAIIGMIYISSRIPDLIISHWPWEYVEEIKQFPAVSANGYVLDKNAVGYDFCSAPRDEWKFIPAGYYKVYPPQILEPGEIIKNKIEFISTTIKRVEVIDCYRKELKWKY